MKEKLTILVCYFREKYFNFSEEGYLEIQCGKKESKIDLEILGDDAGDNISDRNRFWSEITGSYWYWKNDAISDFVGICSYRRFFNLRKNKQSPVRMLSLKNIRKLTLPKQYEILDILGKYDAIVPLKYTYAYPINVICEKNYNKEDFQILENTISIISPEYLSSYRKIYYKSNKLFGHNMFIMKGSDYEEFCNWVFKLLFEVESKINPKDYPLSKIRVFGYMHEILLGVFIEQKKMRLFYSQISWITENPRGFKFNSIIYRVLCNINFWIKYKFLRRSLEL